MARVYHDHMVRAGAVWWRNADYLVQAALAADAGMASSDAPPAAWLRIYRHDGARLATHWRELQRIKSELVGPEFEAAEVYPRESRLKDGENSYHLWIPLGWSLPFGLPGGRAPTSDGIPAVSTRFVRAGAATASDVLAARHCHLIASGIDVSRLSALAAPRQATDGFTLPSGNRHVLTMDRAEKDGVEVEGGLVEALLDAIEPYVGRPRVEVLNLLVMAPGDAVPEHVDPRQPQQVGTPIRMHLVLDADLGCEFTIGGETIEHCTGDLWRIKGTDRLPHSARNRSGRPRTIACFNLAADSAIAA